jgi:hypothetical protein
VERDLIDGYLVELRRSLTWRPDVADLVEEVEGHLREAVARLRVSGVAEDEAQRRTLACFGELALVARAYSQSADGDLAVPTRATRLAGAAAWGAAVTWIAAVVVGAAGAHTDLFTEWTLARYQVWTGVLMLATGLTCLTLVGLLQRGGAVRGRSGLVVVALGVSIMIALVPMAWFVTGLMAPIAIAVVLATRPVASLGLGHPWPYRAMTVAWPVAAAGLVIGDEVIRIGPADAWGDHPSVWLAAFAFGAVVFAVGLAAVGARLLRERAADLSRTPLAPLAG